MTFTLLVSLFVFAALITLLYLIDRGYANTVDALAYWLHMYAKSVRTAHEEKARGLRAAWIKELEKA